MKPIILTLDTLLFLLVFITIHNMVEKQKLILEKVPRIEFEVLPSDSIFEYSDKELELPR